MKPVLSSAKRCVQRGFTLIELAVVVAILGVLIVMLAPSVLGSKSSATANLLTKSAQSIADNWILVAQSCGTTTDAAASPVILSGKSMGDVIFGGSANVDTNYTSCYSQARVLAMSDVGQPKSGGWTVSNFTVTFSGGGTAPLQTTYANVPDDIVLIMAQKYTPSLAALVATGDSTSSVIRYGAPTNGARDVTVLRTVS